jgi:hypothetical protein
MHLMLRRIARAGLFALGVLLALGNTPAPAQAPAATYPGYYYSPGGYSGGRYFAPGYYARPRTTVVLPSAVVPRPSVVTRVPRQPRYIEDWSTGRTNYPLPLTKPWMRPLQ